MPRPRSPRLQQVLQATLRRAVALACLAAVPAHAQEATRGPAAAAGDDPAAVTAPASGRADGGDRCAIETVVDPRIDELLQADPDDPRIDITSDTGDLGRAGDASLSGNVTIRMGQRLLTADQATVDAEQRSIELKGDVEYLDPQMNVRGKGGSFQQGGRGEFSGAEFRLHDSSVRGAAQNASLSPSGNIKLEGVRYTACPPGNEDWSLGAGAIEIDQESRIGTGRDVRIDFLGVPIFYTPWISFPVGDQPKSGLLFPTVGSSSRSGTQVAVPYYWFLAPNYDATLTTRWYSSRGLRLDPELRFLSERSRSQLNVEYLVDDRERGGSRGVIDWRHVTRFAPRTRLLIDATDVSDTDYFEDFGVGFEGTSVSFVNRYIDLRHHLGAWNLNARAQGYQVIDEHAGRSRRAVSHRAATDGGGTLARPAGRPVRLSVRRGHQLPARRWVRRVCGSMPNPRSNGASTATAPSLQPARATATRSTCSTTSRRAPTTRRTARCPRRSLDTGFTLERASGSRGDRIQTLEPRLLYLYVPYTNQDDLPVFDTGIPDLNLVQLFRTNRYVGPGPRRRRQPGEPRA